MKKTDPLNPFEKMPHSSGVLRTCGAPDFEDIYATINDGAQAYQGVIPADCWHEPYMTRQALTREIQNGVLFWGIELDGHITAVMGLQNKKDVTLIRHAYVRTSSRRNGLGSRLLSHLEQMTRGPILIGTWADASWAISFYRKHGYNLLPEEEKNDLLPRYWSISQRQIETSVVLACRSWFHPKEDLTPAA